MAGGSGFTKAWIVWGAASGLSFAALEAKALRTPGPNTLSSHLRRLFGFDDRGLIPPVRRGLFYLLWGWFGLHILHRTAGCVSCINPPTPHP